MVLVLGYDNIEYGRYCVESINCLLTHSLTTEDGTCGGTAKGAKCVFPFKYNGFTYNKCIKTDFDDKFWCSTEPVFNTKWGNCDCGQCFDGFWVLGVSMIAGSSVGMHELCVLPLCLNAITHFKPLAVLPQVATSFLACDSSFMARSEKQHGAVQ